MRLEFVGNKNEKGIHMIEKFKNMRNAVAEFAKKIKNEKARNTFLNCFYNTLETTTEILEDGTSYVFTGDIPAMWLRDSSVQVSAYLPFADIDEDVARLIFGLLLRQYRYIAIDPYANAFNKAPADYRHKDETGYDCEWVWERKFEIDSLLYPMWLTAKYYSVKKDKNVFGDEFVNAIQIILKVFETEQSHDEKSNYYFKRTGYYCADTLDNNGKGRKTKPCGLVWSAFRPSDDKCEFHYLIPSNMMIVSVFRNLAKCLTDAKLHTKIKERLLWFAEEVDIAIKEYAVVDSKYGKIYAFETDGYGNYNLMDDANVPSLLSLPYLEYCSPNDEIYLNTRNFIFSEDNKYYYKGKFADGVGSPHTPENYIWHIAIVMRILTSVDQEEKRKYYQILLNTDAEKGFMHEGFNKDNPKEYTREWFAWANTLFALATFDIYSNV